MIPLKALLFDFGGTLDANGLNWLQRVRPLYARLGIDASGGRFAQAFYEADDHLHERHSLEGLDLTETALLQTRDVLANLGEDAGLASKVVEPFVAEARSRLSASRLLLADWKDRFRLGIVSNNYGNLASLLEREGLLDLFDVVADSGRIGAVKPDPRIFMAALDPLGLKPAEAMMVGDSQPRDMRGAERLGMPHAWLTGGSGAAPCCGSVVVLKSLAGLKNALSADGELVG